MNDLCNTRERVRVSTFEAAEVHFYCKTATWNIGGQQTIAFGVGRPYKLQCGPLRAKWNGGRPFYDTICLSDPCSNYPFLLSSHSEYTLQKLQSLHTLPPTEGYCLNTTLKNGAARNCDLCSSRWVDVLSY